MRAFGISRDSPWSHVAWEQALDLNVPLLSDWNAEATRGFGVGLDFNGMREVSSRSAFQSERSGTFRSSACSQATCDQGESREIPNARAPSASSSGLLSRRSSISLVQVDDQSKR